MSKQGNQTKIKEVKEMNECKRHHWRTEHEPEILKEMALEGCPLCILEEQRDKEIEGAQKGWYGFSWEAAEELSIKYSNARQRHAEKLSLEERTQWDKEIVAEHLSQAANLGR